MKISSFTYQIVTTIEDLQKCFFIRAIVFCEEQKCPYSREMDGLDYSATHFLCTMDNEPVATARMRLFKDYAKIERLAVREAYRGKSLGKELFAFVIKHINEMGYKKIVIHAQAYLVQFYADFGFVKQGEPFFDANIEHYYMEKLLK